MCYRVRSRNLKNEVALARVGLLRRREREREREREEENQCMENLLLQLSLERTEIFILFDVCISR
jgi:hypothetical protein